MIRFKQSEDSGLALPESTPVTLLQVDSSNLPYACHCPLCGGIFQIPEALLYKIEEDDFADDVDDTEFAEMKGNSSQLADNEPDITVDTTETSVETASGGEENATTI